MQTPTSSCQMTAKVSVTTPNRHHSNAAHGHTTPVSSNSRPWQCPPTGSMHQRSPTSGGFQSPHPNPFEIGVDRLHDHVMTPGVFKHIEVTPDGKPKSFWDPEHIALLDPCDFGDVSEKLLKQDRYNRTMDHLAQGAVDKFFEKEYIVPSPWSEPTQKVNLLAKIQEEERLSSRCNASCQTDVHIPLDVDFNKLIGSTFILSTSQTEDLNRGDSFSNSSLRRKLFYNNDSSTSSSQTSSPEKDHVPSEDCWDSPPLHDLYSSSPMHIHGESLLERRRCSTTALNDLQQPSPDISPISSPVRPCKINSSLPRKLSESFKQLAEEVRSGNRSRTNSSLPDEIQLSNCGLDNSDSDNDISHMEMQPSSFPGAIMMPRMACLEHSALEMSFNDHCTNGTNTAADTGYQSASTTDFQSVSGVRIGDMSVSRGITETKIKHRSGNMDISVTRENDWEPPSSSTPNKDY